MSRREPQSATAGQASATELAAVADWRWACRTTRYRIPHRVAPRAHPVLVTLRVTIGHRDRSASPSACELRSTILNRLGELRFGSASRFVEGRALPDA